MHVPDGLDAVATDDVRRHIEANEANWRRTDDRPLPTPRAFLANPSDQAADLVWEVHGDGRVTGCEVRWRAAGHSEWTRR